MRNRTLIAALAVALTACTATPPPDPQVARVHAAVAELTPTGWSTPQIHVLQDGTCTSYADTTSITVTPRCMTPLRLRYVVAHELGHYWVLHNAAPGARGYPADLPELSADRPWEQWAECVATVITGAPAQRTAYVPCTPTQLEYTRNWLAGPAK